MEEANLSLIWMALIGAFLTLAHSASIQKHSSQRGGYWNWTFRFLTVLLLLIELDAQTNVIGIFGSVQLTSSLRNSCAKACNDGFFYQNFAYGKAIQNLTLPEVAPAEPCESTLTLLAAQVVLAAGPISYLSTKAVRFFGNKLIQACRKKPTQEECQEKEAFLFSPSGSQSEY